MRARKSGNASAAKKVDEKNKDLAKMMDIFSKLPNPHNLINDCQNDEELRNKLKSLYKNETDGFLAYKLLCYILATNRSTIRKLQQNELVEIPN
jgi:flagellin-specific chaperone FliS